MTDWAGEWVSAPPVRDPIVSLYLISLHPCPSTTPLACLSFCLSVCLSVCRCIEFKALLSHSTAMADVLPVDASCEDIEVSDTDGSSLSLSLSLSW